jgi:hypothetical protein
MPVGGKRLLVTHRLCAQIASTATIARSSWQLRDEKTGNFYLSSYGESVVPGRPSVSLIRCAARKVRIWQYSRFAGMLRTYAYVRSGRGLLLESVAALEQQGSTILTRLLELGDSRKFAHYKGEGDPEDAKNFECRE